MRRILATSLVAIVSYGCVTNPAVHPRPNSVDLEYIDGPEGKSWRRGSEQLDEQDFYELAGDKEAVEKIESHRASGVRKQTLGLAIVGIGIGVLAKTMGWL